MVKHIKRYSTSLIIREMQIKTTIRYYLTPVRMPTIKQNKTKQKIPSIGENVEKLETLYTAGGNVTWYSYYGKQYGSSSKN